MTRIRSDLFSYPRYLRDLRLSAPPLDDSTDSRHYGAVTREYIKGKVVARMS